MWNDATMIIIEMKGKRREEEEKQAYKKIIL